MGAQHSTAATCEKTPSQDGFGSPQEDRREEELMEQSKTGVVPQRPPPMPTLARAETFEERLYRKFKAEPLVPIGCITTAFFLGSGIKSFYNRDPARSQVMMRLRVASQFATILIFVGYAGWNAVTFDFAPGMAVPSEQFQGAGGGGGRRREGGQGDGGGAGK